MMLYQTFRVLSWVTFVLICGSDDFWSDTGFNLIGEKNVIFDNDDFKNIDVFSEISLQHGDM
jgi:hypothetical protein